MNKRKDKNKERRNIIIIDKPFQIKHFVIIFLASIFISFFLVLLIYWWNINYVRQILTELEIYEEGLQTIMFREAMSCIFPLLLIIIAIAFLFSALELFVTHKIAGPIFRLKKFMKMVETGAYNPELIFRKKDELKDIARSFNNMLSSVLNREKEEIKTIKDFEVRLDSLIAECRNDCFAGKCQDLKRDMEQLRKKKEACIEKRQI
ncbi:MAG: hypothetical protein ISS46_02990 [Candidatus Omnitrophica bacterium]|nr:hypothetical protein [Candidatus Omnitrophota bacterium]